MPAINEIYLQTINGHHDYLAEIQDAFNKQCDEITAKALADLKSLPETDQEGKKKIVEAQKKQNAEALDQLKQNINQSTRTTAQKLEEIHGQRERTILDDLEKQINKI